MRLRNSERWKLRQKQETLVLMFLDDIMPTWGMKYEINGIDVTNAVHRLKRRNIIEHDTKLGCYFRKKAK